MDVEVDVEVDVDCEEVDVNVEINVDDATLADEGDAPATTLHCRTTCTRG